MKLTQYIYRSILFILLVTQGFGGTIILEEAVHGIWYVKYHLENNEISSIVFTVEGADIEGAYGGAADEYGFTISTSEDLVKALSSGTPIPAAVPANTLIILHLSGTPSALTNIYIEDTDGEEIYFSFTYKGCDDNTACNFNTYATLSDGSCLTGDPCWTGCMDDGYQQWSPNCGTPACNYDPDATIEGECLYYDCNGECGGTAVGDDCGECGGGQYDGDVDNDGDICEYSNLEATLSFGEVDLESQTIEIYLENSAPVSGFQLDINSTITITDISGGTAEDMGFDIYFTSTDSIIRVLGFSMDGSGINIEAHIFSRAA
jgi:hypothetical protein